MSLVFIMKTYEVELWCFGFIDWQFICDFINAEMEKPVVLPALIVKRGLLQTSTC